MNLNVSSQSDAKVYFPSTTNAERKFPAREKRLAERIPRRVGIEDK